VSHENWNLVLYAIGTLITVGVFGYGIGGFVFKWKMRNHEVEEGWMTKKDFAEKCREQQENCPQMVTINHQLAEILEYSKTNATAVKHVKECFLLFLSQTEIDEGVRNYIHDKLTDQVQGIKL